MHGKALRFKCYGCGKIAPYVGTGKAKSIALRSGWRLLAECVCVKCGHTYYTERMYRTVEQRADLNQGN